MILDEPTNGLDPQGIHEIRELLLTLNRAGTTIFLSSHLLAEVEQLCTRVGVLASGRLVVQDEMAALRAPTGNTIVHTVDVDAALGLLGSRVVAVDGRRLVVRAADPAVLNAELVAAGVAVSELAVQRGTLEEVVLAATEPRTVGGVEAGSGVSAGAGGGAGSNTSGDGAAVGTAPQQAQAAQAPQAAGRPGTDPSGAPPSVPPVWERIA